MRRWLIGAALSALAAGPAFASLPVGATAPDFSAQASLGGHEFTFSLDEALKKGPVVLYFYPAAFTPGCTIEAHEFAGAIDKFKALHASVIGVSADNIDKLDKFSVSECQSKFPVAADPTEKVIKAYDATLAVKPDLANRTSYVISPDHKVLYAFTDLNPAHHVDNTLAAVKSWDDSHR